MYAFSMFVRSTMFLLPTHSDEEPQNVPKILFFTQKYVQKRLRGNPHEA